ncbi:hypothetical protein ACMU_01065 [Actibacterium mucosum KCTC 23349]|uniref:EamA domain-containing protein n=1 Tax=Actibacterium mucosum KCTC 23349 TaxID=1454373 RepID=A0A037ZKY5_9RHOB|nr:DMT family transporter [Actibacterium mucosum]KAJ57111.1 hypothetical protein ACMU_01065 [Actibacterium mucosum KCTC 23349]
MGIVLRLLAAGLIVAMSACVHWAAKSAPIGQIMFWRSAVALIPILAYLALRGQLATLRTKRPMAHATRGVFGAFSMLCSFVSFAYLSVGTAQALAYLAPLLTLPLARRMLGEVLSPHLWIATIVGFCGVLLFLADDLHAPQGLAMLGIAAGLTYAATMAFVRVHIKEMTVSESPGAIAFYFALLVMGLSAFSAPFGWAELRGETLLALCCAGVLGGLAHIASAEAVARAPVSVLAPFDYSGILWALGFDVLLFAYAPGNWEFLGAVAILVAAAVTLAGGYRKKAPGG